MKTPMKRVIAAVMLVVMLLSNVNMASALVANPLFYGDYTDVAKIYDSNSCPSMQGLAVGSQMMYAIKIKTDNSRAVITMTDKDSGTTTTLKDASTGYSYFTGLDHANDMAVWGIDGSSHIFVATTKQGANAIVRYRRSGSNLYKVATYHLQCGGSDICATAMDVMKVDSSGNIHLITKWGQDIYTGTVHKDTGDTTVNMTKICTIRKDMAYIKGEKLNLSEWVNQGFGYHDNTLFVPLSGPDDALHRSVVLVYNLDNVPLGASIYPTDYLAFRVTSGAYNALFEIESVDICSSDGKLYFNTNRRKTTSDTNHDGISSFDGYTYTKPAAASFDAVKHFNAKFLPNGGSGTMEVQRINNGISTPLSKNLYTKPGYTFVGWTAHRLAQNQWYYCTDRSTTGWYAEGKQPSGYSLYIYYDQQKVSATSNVHADTVEYVAQWTPTNYTVKFDANGGTGTAIADKSFTIENPGTLPANTFSKEGYTFAGWQVSGLGDVLQPGASTTDLINYAGQGNNTDNTITLLANWEANDYTVTWNVDGEKFTTTTVKYGQPITAPAYTAPEGHTFSGWNIPATMPAENITLDATLTVNTYTITWNVDGNITTETYSYGDIPSYKGTIENERHGCTVFYFTGWNQNPAAVTGDFTYIAQFTPATSHTQIVTDAAVEPGCTKTGLTEGSHCEACGNVIVAQEVVDAKGHSEKPVYTNDGDTHSAVYPCCGETYVTGETHSYTDGKCVCQAVQKVTVTVDGNGGQFRYAGSLCDSVQQTTEYGKYVSWGIFSRNQDRTGYTLNEFNTEPDGSGKSYFMDNYTGLHISNVKSDMTLYAQWKPIQYTAQFLPGEGTGEAMPDISFTIESTEGLPECTYTREGYTFYRWSPSGTSYLFSPGWSLANLASYAGDGDSTGTTIKLVAQWEPNKHTITWTINGEEYAQTTGTYGQPITKPEWTTPDGYTFFDWNPPETMPDEDITLDAKMYINSYELIFQDSEGNILTKDFVQYGDPIEFPDSNKEGYTFHGWDYDGTTMPPHVLTITGTWTANTYKVTFTVDGQEYATADVVYGQSIPLPETDPEKEGYRFNGWKDLPETMPANNLTLAADFVEQVTITYLSYDVDKLEYVVDWEGKYDKGATITLGYYPWNYCNTLGWDTNDDGIVDHEYQSEYTVTGDVTMKPVLVPFYADVDLGAEDASFVDAEGNPITRIYAESEYHNFVTVTNHPTRKGYTFLGWYVDQGYYGEGECLVYTNDETGELEVSLSFGSNATATAMWEINTYNVTYTINGEAYQTVPVKYGEAVTAPEYAIPEGHTFSGWDVPETMPAEDITLDAALTVNSYTVTFKVDGEIYKTASFEYGAAVEAPDYDVPVGHTFSGWDVPETMPAEDITLNATVKVNEHKLTLDFDGVTFYSFLTNSEGVYGYSQYLPPELEFPMDYGEKFSNIIIPGVKTGHNFSHFQDQFGNKYELVKKEYLITDSPNPGTTQMFDVLVIESMPDHDLILTPVWTLGTYTVNFYINYQQYTSIEVLYGDPVQAPDYTVPEGYIFSGWDVPATMPGHGLTLHATLTPKTYTVTWLDEAENVVATEAVKHGENAINVPDVPEKEAYTGAWSADAVNVTSDLTIKPEYTAVEYTLILLPGEGAEGERTTMTFTIESEDIILFMEPSFTKLGHYQNYWWLEGKETGNFDDMIGARYHYKDLIQFADENNSVTLVARWVISLYRVSVMRKPGEVVVSTAVGYQTPLAEVEATIVHLWGEELTWEGHTLTGWKWFEDEAGTKAYTGTTIPTYALYAAAQWEANTYTVTWMVDGQEYSKTEVKYGDPIVKLADPTKTGYNFLGWKDDQGNMVEFPCDMPAQNVTYTAQWENTKYTVTYIMNGGEAADGGMEIVDDKFVSTMVHGTPLAFSADGVVKEGHTFIGVLVNGEHLNPDERYIVVSDTLVELQWEANNYTVNWDTDGDGTIDVTNEVAYGQMPEAPAASKAADEQFSYTFAGWNKEVVAVTGDADYTATFTKTGWISDETGRQYIIEDVLQKTGWTEIDGSWYYLDTETGYAATGAAYVPYNTELGYGPDQDAIANMDKYPYDDVTESWFIFDENGAFQSDYTGFYELNGETVYAVNGQIPWLVGLVEENGEYYYFGAPRLMIKGQNLYLYRTNDIVFDNGAAAVQSGMYTFTEDGKLLKAEGITNVNGTLYYYENYRLMAGKGLINVDGNYYYVRSNGALVVGTEYWVANVNEYTNIPTGTYTFDENGVMQISHLAKNGIYQENGKWYYYVEGMKAYAGLISYTGNWNYEDGTVENATAWIYVRSNGELATGRYWTTATNGNMDAGYYNFDAMGKLIGQKNGIVEVNGTLYYYKNDVIQYNAGVINLNGNYYYVRSNGVVVAGQGYWITNVGTSGIPTGYYEFDANGVMQLKEEKNGVVEENGVLYYYENGTKAYAGLIEYDGGVIYVRSNGQLAIGKYWVTKTNGLKPAAEYTFGADGKMINN